MPTDPTYPFYPIACLATLGMLLLVLLTSIIRQSWNLGVAFLCFWLFFENLTAGIDAILWSDNSDIKLYAYCDINSHLQLVTSTVKPMATLVISRRLYLITSLRSVEPPGRAARRKDLAIEWILGFVIPALVAGPIYYIVQGARFTVDEVFGCNNAIDSSILSILLINLWDVIPPLVSVTVYYPHVVRIFYRHNREINDFLQSNDSVSRTNYFRILAVASIDVLLTLPIGIVSIVLLVKGLLNQLGSLPFYYGWTSDHTHWEPVGIPYAVLVAGGTSTVVQFYFSQWTSPVLACAIFALFGVTSEARASYWRIIGAVGGWFGWKPTPRTREARSQMGDIEFGQRPPRYSMSLSLDSNPSFIDRDTRAQENRGEVSGAASSEAGDVSEKDTVEGEDQRETSEVTHDGRPMQPSASHQTGARNASAIV